MKILVSNDDGYFAPGITLLAEALRQLGEVTVVAPEALGGVEVTRLGRRHTAEPVVKLKTPRGETAYWIGPAGGAADAGPGTDFHAVESRRVSVTPLRMDLTHGNQLARAKEWLAA